MMETTEVQNSKLWTRDFILATCARMFASFMFMMLSTTIATVCFEVYDSSVSEAGAVVGIFIIGALVSRIFAGRYTEVIGRRRLLVAGHAVMLLLSLLYFIPMGVGAFALVRFLHGISFGIATNTTQVVGTSYIPKERWGEGMGFFSLSVSLSSAVGPFIGLGLLQVSITAMYIASTVCCLLALVVVVALRIPNVQSEEADPAQLNKAKGFHLRDYFEIKAVPLSALLMVWAVCYAGMNSFANTYGTMLGLAAFVPAFFGLHSAANIVSRMPVGKLYDRMGENIVILPSIVCFVMSLVLFAFCSGPVTLMLSGLLSGLGYGSLFFMAQSLALESVPPQRMGVAVSTFFVFADTGAGLGPLIMGLIHPVAGYPGMFAIAAIVCAFSIPAYFVLHGARRRGGKTNPVD